MRGQAVVLREFSGLNTSADPAELPPSLTYDLLDVEPNGSGGLHRREGSTWMATLDAAPVSIFHPSLISGPVYASSAGEMRRSGSATIRATGIVNPEQTQWAEAPQIGGTQGPLFFTRWNSSPLQWDGTAAAAAVITPSAGTVPDARTMVYAGNRLIVANFSNAGGNPSRVQASGLQNPTNWGTGVNQGWAVDVNVNDGGMVNALGVAGPYVIVFKTSSIHVIYDLDTGANRPLAHNLGVEWPTHVVSTGSGCFFVADDGVYFTDGQTIRRVSDALDPNLFTNRVSSPLRIGGGGASTKITFKLAYVTGFLAVAPQLSTTKFTLLYSERTQSWWRLSFYMTAAYGLPAGVGGNKAQNFILSHDGSVEYEAWAPVHSQRMPINPNDWTGRGAGERVLAVAPYWTTPALDFGSSDTRKRIRRVEADYEMSSGSLALSTVDDGASTKTATLPTAATSKIGSLLTPGVSRRWQMKLAGTGLWVCHEVVVRLQARKA